MDSCLIVGGGLVGLATAYHLQRLRPGVQVILLEKENRPGAHQSTHNSGVLHSGLYYQPGSLKARLAVEGIREMIAFCRQQGVPHEICGKLVVATMPEELPRLDELMRRGAANGLTGLRLLDAAALRRIEPNAAGLAAAHVPEEGIVDYRAVCEQLAACIRLAGGALHLNTRVVGLHERSDGWTALAADGREFNGSHLINCAGLQCDRIARLAQAQTSLRIVPFRGEYHQLTPEAAHLVKHLIYPVPDPAFPFLGVHFTRLIAGGIEAGPNAVLAFAREGYRLTDINLRDLAESLGFPGLWRFLRKYPSMVTTELGLSLSRTRFCRSLQRLVPDLRPRDLTTGGAGVRAQAMTPAGDLVQDFSLVTTARALHVLNAPSPAATASLAIGRHLVLQLP